MTAYLLSYQETGLFRFRLVQHPGKVGSRSSRVRHICLGAELANRVSERSGREALSIELGGDPRTALDRLLRMACFLTPPRRLASRQPCKRDAVFNESDPLVQFKLDILRRALPAQDAIVFGDIYGVEGGYTAKCIEYGCCARCSIDTHETAPWLRRRLDQPALDFYKGDFADPSSWQACARVTRSESAFDVLLHQAPLLHTIHLMLEKVRERFLVVQPMLEEQPVPNSVVYLPGNSNTDLHPFARPTGRVPRLRRQRGLPVALDLGDDPDLPEICVGRRRLRDRPRGDRRTLSPESSLGTGGASSRSGDRRRTGTGALTEDGRPSRKLA